MPAQNELTLPEFQPFAMCTTIFVDGDAWRTAEAAECSSSDVAWYPDLLICPVGQSKPSLISLPICQRGTRDCTRRPRWKNVSLNWACVRNGDRRGADLENINGRALVREAPDDVVCVTACSSGKLHASPSENRAYV